jgi:hypothetical protein
VIRLSFFFLLVACNGAPANTCVVPGHSVVSGGTAATSCDGTCANLPLADGGDAGIQFCTIDCTAGGQAACAIPGTACISARSKGFNLDTSYCFYPCGPDDAGAVQTCPTSYFCYADAGVCL